MAGKKQKKSPSTKALETAFATLILIIILTLLGVILDLSGVDNVISVNPVF